MLEVPTRHHHVLDGHILHIILLELYTVSIFYYRQQAFPLGASTALQCCDELLFEKQARITTAHATQSCQFDELHDRC